MSKQLDQYRKRYMQAVRTQMAARELTRYADIAEIIHSTDKILVAIANNRQYPTVQQGIDLCRTCGYSANWLFLGKGEPDLQHQAALNEILKAVQK